MLTNKDIRVENGNLVLNGDKYPLDGQSPETIMEIIEDNSDTTPTENSTAPITSGGVYTALGTKQDTLTFDNAPTASSNNPVKSDGIKTYVDNAVSPINTNLKDFKNLFVSNPESTSETYHFSIPTNAIAELTAVSGTNLAQYYIIAAGTTLRIIKHTDDVTGLEVTLESITDGVYNYTVTVPAFALSVAYRIR